MSKPINNPACTYRLQLHRQFTFEELEGIVTYLERLGVATIYASPIFKSVPGSTHGYDGLCPLEINPEIGSLEQFRKLIGRLRQMNVGWLQDIVPNHMAFHHSNEWLMDVLEKGKRSAYVTFFDIDWTHESSDGKLMVPFLGSPLSKAMENGEIKMACAAGGRVVVTYFDNVYPVNASGYAILFNEVENQDQKVSILLSQLDRLEQVEDEHSYASCWKQYSSDFAGFQQDGNFDIALQQALERINTSPELLKKIIKAQHYRLCHWQETDTRINYRRFFTVNGLICMNIHHKDVFDHYHKFIKSLVQEGLFHGLRVDHIDGLYDPATYLDWLKQLTGEQTYISVEKILQKGESLPLDWNTQGTTGYDFLALVNNLFTNKKNGHAFRKFYKELTEEPKSIEVLLHEKKAYILYLHMAGELDNLYQMLLQIVGDDPQYVITRRNLKKAIGEFLVYCPVYRYYPTRLPLEGSQISEVKEILRNVREKGDADPEALDLLEQTLLKIPDDASDNLKNSILHFYKRCMQFTGPLMAKGLEDTFMYTYVNFIGHNDVGDSPANFGSTQMEFHNAMIERQKNWPLALNTTSTHDTKRGEDVRARLNVLSDLPGEWFQAVRRWRKENHEAKQEGIPNACEEYFLYQNLVGAYPMPGSEDADFEERLLDYLVKSLREAKTNSNWTTPKEDYESRVKQFASKVLTRETPFWQSFERFHKKVADFGIINSLSQLLLKFTCPGIPDVYQGCELWDLSFVDPDNRRPVDFGSRIGMLNKLHSETYESNLLRDLWERRNDGQIKLWLTHRLMQLRSGSPEIFQKADYIPLEVTGSYAGFVFAFARNHGPDWLIVVVPLHLAELCDLQSQADVFSIDWKDTEVAWPVSGSIKMRNLLNMEQLKREGSLAISQLFSQVPFAMLSNEIDIFGSDLEKERGAGQVSRDGENLEIPSRLKEK